MTDDQQLALAETFAQVARALLDEEGEDATLDRICALLDQTIDNCEAAGISILRKGKVENHSSTNDIPGRLDEIQTETQEGPCVDAIKDHEVFITGDLAAEERWEHFSHRAHAETGVTSVLAVRLYTDDKTMGALNLYSTVADAFDDHDVATAVVFATHAAVALHDARREANLKVRADTRDVIGMAKGMLMAHSHVSADEAFEMLRKASQRTNVKVRDIAAQVVRRSAEHG